MRSAAVGMVLYLLACALQAGDHVAQEILDEADVRGGLIVHLGCGDGKLTAALRLNDRCLVHGLDADTATVAKARKHIQSLGLYGPVSVDAFDGKRLPYADNLVNLIVVSGECRVASEEIMRVLAPEGVALIGLNVEHRTSNTEHRNKNSRSTWTFDVECSMLDVRIAGNPWKMFKKPRPANIDEWNHYLHSAGGNPVADDDAVKPPRQLQWVGDPQWARHHEHMASMSALVSSNGKVFSICDEGPKVSMLHPPEWKLSARDAFNGLLLWERSIAEWFNHLQPLKNGPASLPRRLVAQGKHVYVTLGIHAPVSVLDAGTGQTLFDCKGTKNTQEIILSEGVLFLLRGESAGSVITAVKANTGKRLWEKPGPVTALTLAVDKGRVVYFDGRKVIALSGENGSALWRSERLGEESKAGWLAKNPPRLILADPAIVVAPRNKMYALSADDGTVWWSADHPRSGYVSPKDLFVIDNLVWYGDTAGAKNTGRFIGRDIKTGEIRKSFVPDIDIIWLSHHRCHFSKATKNFILPARMGVEFVDLENEQWKQHHWVRGGCIYGIMPCNGLLYTPPHACACYFEAKHNGFSAFTSKVRSAGLSTGKARLEKGPAYTGAAAAKPAINHQPSTINHSSAWPVFRHDSARSGHTDDAVSANLVPRWSADLGGKLTQPVSAGGRVYVASIDRRTLHALNAETGKPVWQYMAGARINSPPSIYRGMAIFGCRDGWIYCLRCRDGELNWRFRAAPDELRIMSYGQLESAWPVHGSVLIQNGEIHCVAGRNMFLDGGLRYLRLDPVTGRKISETIMDEMDPVRGGTIQKYDSWLDMTTTLPDVLASDGKNVYMRSLPFDLEGRRRRISHFPDTSEPARLFSPTGFLDDNWFHRSYWTYARCFPGGWNGHLAAGRYNPSGRLLVVDDSTIYGYGRKPSYYRWTTSLEYRLFATEKKNEPRDMFAWDKFKEAQAKRFPRMQLDKTLAPPYGPKALPKNPYGCLWEDRNPSLHVRAMVSTKNGLFIAGPKDIMDEKDHYFRNASAGYEQIKDDSKKQAEIWGGKDGAMLLAISKEDGKKQAQYRLDALPVFDGMIAAGGRLYVSLESGDLICLGGR